MTVPPFAATPPLASPVAVLPSLPPELPRGAALPRVFLQAGHDRRIAAGHPWAYSNEIRMDAEIKTLPAGTLATLHRVDGKPFGVGTFHPHTLIGFRLLDRDPQRPIDRAFFARRISRALSLRERLFAEPFYRLIHAEADGLPGLICDRFDRLLVLQLNTAGMQAQLPVLLEAFDQVLRPDTLVLRNDSAARALEGLDSAVNVARGDINAPVELREGGLRLLADVLGGQKTGWFFDQRDNRAVVAAFAAEAAVLDLYCYTGGFGLRALAAGARHVTFVDSSEPALALARRAAEANGLIARCTFLRGDVFDVLPRLAEEKARFELVIADPPAFVKSRKDLGSGLRGYRKLARLAAGVTAPDGFLFEASCSHNVAPSDLLTEVVAGVRAAARESRLLHEGRASADHPVHGQLPETAYLKSLLLQLD